MESYSTPAAIREMQIKTSHIALHTHQNGQNKKDKIKTSVKMWWGCKMAQPFLEKSGNCSKGYTYDPATPLLDVHPREGKTYVHAKPCTRRCKAALLTGAKQWEQPRCPSTDDG